MTTAVIIGAGLGGLSAAIRLASAGCKVTVIEQQNTAGGKLQRIQHPPYTFDRGPSTITMLAAFERVFRSANRRMEDYVTFYRISDGTRNCFGDGSIVDLSSDIAAVEEQIAAYSSHDARQYQSFMKESAALYRLSDRYFLNRLLLSWKDKADPRMLAALLRVKPFTTLHELLRRYFKHENTLAMFGRYATYVGSEPARAPAIFAMLPHLEAELGIYGVKGGTYAIAEAFQKLAVELGVTIHTNVRVTRILTNHGSVKGVEIDNKRMGGAEHTGNLEQLRADIVIVGGDTLSANRELLPEEARPRLSNAKIHAMEPSLSGFVMLAGVPRRYELLLHHTVLFPERYGTEFDDIFRRKVAPTDPAIYLCYSGYSEGGMAPEGGSNLFILANAPYLSKAWEWNEESTAVFQEKVIGMLEQRGLHGLGADAEHLSVYTPAQLRQDTSAYRGAIYGISSNSAAQTFARPSNRSDISGLWFVGGTTHPGGGTPLVTLSGQLVAEAVIRERKELQSNSFSMPIRVDT